MLKRFAERKRVTARLDESEQLPAGMTRRQNKRYLDDLIRRREVETATVLDAVAMAAAAAPPVDEQPVEPVRPGWRRRMWDRRPLFAALLLDAALLYVIIPTQIGYYRAVGGLNPELGSLVLRTYLLVPVATESLSAFFGLMAGYVIDHGTGRYKKYLRLMWFFAGVAAVVNVKNGWQHVADDTHVTAILLGGLSLCVPLVWHSYTGMRVAVEHVGLTIAELSRISRGWMRHPVFSWRTARAVDLFPELSRHAVWDLIVKNHKAKLVNKWSSAPVSRKMRRAQLKKDLRDLSTADVKIDHVVNVDDIERRWWKRTRPAAGPDDTVTVNRPAPDVDGVDDCSPGATSGVDILEHPETPGETTGEIRARERIIAVWFDHQGEHLPVRRELPWGIQSQLARELGVSKSHVSNLFRECREGKYKDANPFMSNREVGE